MRENTKQKNSEYSHFLRSVHECKKHKKMGFYLVHIFPFSVCKWEFTDQINLVFYVFSIVFFPEIICNHSKIDNKFSETVCVSIIVDNKLILEAIGL